MNTSAIEACKKDLYTPKAELLQIYPLATAEKVVRVRDMYQMIMADPTRSQREIVADAVKFYGVTEQCAYSDMRIVKELIPTLTESKRAFHRWKANEMLMQAWEKAKAKDDYRTMERIASSYAKFNRIDQEDEAELPYEDIRIQPFVATDNPEVLGLKRIPNLDEEIRRLYERYRSDSTDIEDVSYEEADLQEDKLFSPVNPTENAADTRNE